MKQEIASIISLPVIRDPRGNLTVVEELEHVPFAIGKAEWIFCISANGASHHILSKRCLVVALAGEAIIKMEEGEVSPSFHLEHPAQGLQIPAGTAFTLTHCSDDAVVLILHEQP